MRRLLPLLVVLWALGCARGGPSPELLAVARTILTTVLAGQAELLADLRAPA